MTEKEYITAANLARLRAAYAILQQMIPGYGVSDDDLRTLLKKTDDAVYKAFKDVNTEAEPVDPKRAQGGKG